MRFAPRRFLSIFVSIFSLLANGDVFACVEEMAGDMGATATRWIDCRSWCDFDQPRLSAGKSWEKTVTIMAIAGFPSSKNVQTAEIHPVFRIRRPPPNPPNDRNYASLIGIVKNLN